MQTFLPYKDPYRTARILDNKRLGKQRVEALQIAYVNLGLQKSNSWKNHPAVLMWKHYLPYLVYVYLDAILVEWEDCRNFNNNKCKLKWNMLKELFSPDDVEIPHWITFQFCYSHQSNLVRKNPEYYRKYFPTVLDNLPYIWE